MSGRTARQATVAGKQRAGRTLTTSGSSPAFDVDDVEIETLLAPSTAHPSFIIRPFGTDLFATSVPVEVLNKVQHIDSIVEDIEFGEDGTEGGQGVTASLILRRPDPLDPNSQPVQIGHQIIVNVIYKGKRYELLRMRVTQPTALLSEGEVDVDLIDPLAAIRQILDNWHYRKDKGHPNGWRADQIVRDAAQRSGVPVGVLMRGKYLIPKLSKENTPLSELVVDAYDREHDKTGRQGIIRMTNGKLEVVGQSRNRVSYVIGPECRDISVTSHSNVDSGDAGNAPPITQINAKGHSGKGSGKVTYQAKVFDQLAVNRFGRIARVHDFGRVDGYSDLVATAKRYLARQLRIVQTADVTAPFLPFVKVGDAVVVDAAVDQDFGGAERVAFVISYQHSLTSSDRTTTLSLIEQDNYLQYRDAKEKALRAFKRKQRTK